MYDNHSCVDDYDITFPPPASNNSPQSISEGLPRMDEPLSEAEAAALKSGHGQCGAIPGSPEPQSATVAQPDMNAVVPDGTSQLLRLVSTRDGGKCFECDQPDPDWCAVKHGVFVCLNCSSFHRSIGTHLSVVKSVRLDSWPLVRMKMMKAGGHQRAREHFQRHGLLSLPIRQRYEHVQARAYAAMLEAEVNGTGFDAGEWVRANPTLTTTDRRGRIEGFGNQTASKKNRGGRCGCGSKKK